MSEDIVNLEEDERGRMKVRIKVALLRLRRLWRASHAKGKPKGYSRAVANELMSHWMKGYDVGYNILRIGGNKG